MTGIFTYRGNFSFSDIPQLEGKVALVTGGQAGIGQEISTQLLSHGISKLFILARSQRKFNGALEKWRKASDINLVLESGSSDLDTDANGLEIGGTGASRIEFVQCDLGDMLAVRRAAEHLRARTERLDLLFCNAGLPTLREYSLSPQGIENIFATNCVGHFILTNLLLPILKTTITKHGASNVRVIVTSSSLHMFCRELNFDLLTSPTRTKPSFYDGVWRYARSKAGNILFTRELSRRLMVEGEQGVSSSSSALPSVSASSRSGGDDAAGRQAGEKIYVNCFFPGNIATEQMEVWKSYFGVVLGWLVKMFFALFGQSTQDGAATAMFLATNPKVTEREGIRGQYFIPVAKRDNVSKLAGDMKLARELWDWCDKKAHETLGAGWKTK